MSVSTGGGKGKSSSSTSSPTANTLAALASQFARETAPVRNTLLADMESVLKGGNFRANQPIIGKAVESSMQAASRARRETSDELARTGLAGTPFGVGELAKVIQEGEQKTSQIAPQMQYDINNLLLQMIPNFILGQASNATSGLSNAIAGDVKKKETALGFGGSK